MARPKKKGVDYFPFDIDFFEDEKIVAIAGEYGIKGEMTAVKLLCAVYRNGYYTEWSEMLKMKMLRSLPGISLELLDQIVNRLVKWGFFDKTLFDSDKILTSLGIQRRYFSITRKRTGDDDYPYLLVSFAKNGVSSYINHVSSEFIPPETTQSKGKEIKISTEVDTKRTTSSSIEQEIEILKKEDFWLDQLQVLHAIDVEKLRNYLDDFRVQCVADGKEQHPSIQDAKQHFNSWLRIITSKKRETSSSSQRKGKSTTNVNDIWK